MAFDKHDLNSPEGNFSVSEKNKSALFFIIIIASIVLLDQLTKYIVLQLYSFGEISFISDRVFSITLVKNTGAAFGIFSGIPFFKIVFIGFSLIALFVVYFSRKYIFSGPGCLFAGVSMLTGGIIGNLIDRIFRGHVIDFIDIDIPDINIEFANIFLGRWPAFNIADSCICAGTVLVLYFLWKHDTKFK